MIRLLLVEDQDLVRYAVKGLLEGEGSICVVGECDSGESALSYCRENALPDVILMDLHMPGIGGIEASHAILQEHPNARILILTGQSESPLPKHLMELGVYGYITKKSSPREMQQAISQVSAGHRYLSQDEAQRLALGGSGASNPLDALSRREMELLIKIALGCTNREIQKHMQVSPKTISTYRTRLMEKLDAKSDVELARIAQQYGVVESVYGGGVAEPNNDV
ncbi:two component transcriptional regulator, LuxR family [gamma proteobacterium HTCC5015]|nr:two component transcriptional regulator, LuxR family [gamma proteobacterium HTCC5015]